MKAILSALAIAGVLAAVPASADDLATMIDEFTVDAWEYFEEDALWEDDLEGAVDRAEYANEMLHDFNTGLRDELGNSIDNFDAYLPDNSASYQTTYAPGSAYVGNGYSEPQYDPYAQPAYDPYATTDYGYDPYADPAQQLYDMARDAYGPGFDDAYAQAYDEVQQQMYDYVNSGQYAYDQATGGGYNSGSYSPSYSGSSGGSYTCGGVCR
jgi:hypothetical protein